MRLVFLFSAAFALNSQLVSAQEVSVPTPEQEREFWRTTYCVAGRLPPELRTANNCTETRVRNFDYENLDRLAEQLNSSLQTLLKESVTGALDEAGDASGEETSINFTVGLFDDFVDEVVKRSPAEFGLGYCGDESDVGGAAYAAIAEYFSRVVEVEEGAWAGLLTESEAQSSGGFLLMFGVALRLAEIEFRPEEVLAVLAE